MKNTLLFLFLTISVFAWSQDYNITDNTGKKQGEWIQHHKNGKVRYKGKFKDNNPIGLFLYFYDTGKLQTKMHFFGHSSYASIYYKTGELKATGKYERQKKDSTWVYYNLKGKKISEENYTKGKKNGFEKSFYDSGKIAEEKEFHNDFENGIWKQYYDTGVIKMKATYENGSVEGKQYYYNTKGQIILIGHIKHGARHGFWTFYNTDGTVENKEEYNNGVRVDNNKNENLIIEGSYKLEKQDHLEFEDLHPPKR